MTSFVFKYFLASFPLFSIFCSIPTFLVLEVFHLGLRAGASQRPATTNCREVDHNYRLSWPRQVVKRKMQEKRTDSPEYRFSPLPGSPFVIGTDNAKRGMPADPASTIPDLAGDIGPPDLARNLQHYLYGHPKQS